MTLIVAQAGISPDWADFRLGLRKLWVLAYDYRQ